MTPPTICGYPKVPKKTLQFLYCLLQKFSDETFVINSWKSVLLHLKDGHTALDVFSQKFQIYKAPGPLVFELYGRRWLEPIPACSNF